ncbi:MAG: DUF4890 domain-containing protein [Bacteroidaceae bacterium]|nr:DUF4890 domain-containing protein [Bacteroidaceae bacterium]
MKRTMIICLSLFLGLATMMAQDTKQCPKGEGQQGPKLTVEQKAQLITDRMAKAYDLTEDQKAKLLELNTKVLAEKCHKPAACPQGGEKKCDKAASCPKDGEKKCDKPERKPFGYFKALSEIMTPEQFAAWRTDKMIERSLMPQRPQMRGHQRGFGPHGKPGFGPQGRPGFGLEGKPGFAKEKCDKCGKEGKDAKCDKCKKNSKCEKACKPCKCSGKCGKKECKNCKKCKK